MDASGVDFTKFINEMSQEQIEEYTEAFQLYDQDDSGTISVKELGTLLRCLGQNPDPEEITEMMDVSWHTFHEILNERSKF